MSRQVSNGSYIFITLKLASCSK